MQHAHALASINVRPTSRRLKRFAVDMDRASFGHDVVEIETMSTPEEADLVSARDSITALALSVGAQREGGSGQPIKARFGTTGVHVLLFFSLSESIINTEANHFLSEGFEIMRRRR